MMTYIFASFPIVVCFTIWLTGRHLVAETIMVLIRFLGNNPAQFQ